MKIVNSMTDGVTQCMVGTCKKVPFKIINHETGYMRIDYDNLGNSVTKITGWDFFEGPCQFLKNPAGIFEKKNCDWSEQKNASKDNFDVIS